MATASSEKATKKPARVPKHANGHAAAAPAAAATDAAVEPPAAADGSRAKSAKKVRRALAEPATAAVAAPDKVKRAKKEKVVRDSFTMPKSDYDKLAQLKQKCLDAGVAVKKSELLRAGLHLLDSVPAKRLLEAVSAIETVKTGRPAQS
ncbi:hypothetical protein B0G57_11023 [Trinickia symbiotica]|uniref:Uncharacterized protein n=1 Tax=Trinickia symbiotica TaxID=863227 RepID=A0A2N7X787_9BURK|nr:hypothetical protein [Trinickia symbiotica]PMS37629.1 hypothetical protein C0Z20_06615 [Trinickia symbiotica]PPK43951.1 hypothetical protein B0G57_11023 [Trinickia symbiotica]